MSNQDKPYGPIDPNSQHQIWSRWVICFVAIRSLPTVEEINDNARRFFALLFRSTVGRVKTVITDNKYVEITCEIEGVIAYDASVREAAKKQIRNNFVVKGFNQPNSSITISILAGDVQDGKPPAQMIVMPGLINENGLLP